MRISVDYSGITDLRDDLAALPRRASNDVRRAVRHASIVGNRIAKDEARAKSGPHGRNYFKRIKVDAPRGSVMGWWSAEYGPTGVPKSEFVGAGFRHGTNTDLDISAARAGEILARDVRKAMDSWFWGAD
ncbi:hypothetical protein [Nocardioides sp.]|uniref:hypothetical protein n=1 Tax=Nocardioides sp. TaxID=35761 RepID=UPI0035121BB0